MKKVNYLLILLCTFLTACNFAPHYQQPPMPIPPHYKESVRWIRAKPKLNSLKENCPWWTVYDDKTLNELEEKLTRENPNLQSAYDRFQESRAILQAAKSQLYPTILGFGSESRQKNSSAVANHSNQSQYTYDTITLQAYLNYEIDAWGAIRNTVSASAHAARATQFDLASIDLSLHAELASVYFQIRSADAAQIALDNIVKAYQHALRLVRHLHRGGAVSALDEDQAVSVLEKAKAAAIDIRLQRAKLENALAVLVGEIPSNFHIKPDPTPMKFVALSPNLPSELLIQRPDVAAAVQRMKSANANIGVARAAFFPNITLSGLLGSQSQTWSSLFTRPSLIWALGPPSGLNPSPAEFAQVIFDGYYLQANLKQAKAGYYETVNRYRQTVLQAFEDVEDGLVAVYRLNQENQKQQAATNAASRALFQANQRMIEGMDTYLDVVEIEYEKLALELGLIQVMTQRQLASVYLIKALGGGWKLRQSLKEQL